ncbi:unnamed protein product [Allacma fusca]|uniref:Cyclin-dependent kinase inhibitor domain-containing protein n=1 Tax=Allacma fusca TaxID=39272 RepID=A0A8J2JVH9_9HEXA|nr:unnamed protein product [Allacma fusca]
MSARVCSPPMDLSRNSDIIPSCPSSSSMGTNSLPTSATMPPTHSAFYPNSMSSSSTSSASTVVELTAKRNVSRNLFGSPDPRSAQFARDKIKEIKKADTKRWNFDFDKELPLDGRYKWEPVTTELSKEGPEKMSSVPAAYACHRLPFISSSSGSTSQIVRSTSSISSSSSRSTSNLEGLYYTPATTTATKSQPENREPLLFARPMVVVPPSSLPQSISQVNMKAGPSLVGTEQRGQSTTKSSTAPSDPSLLIPFNSNNNTSSVNRSSSAETVGISTTSASSLPNATTIPKVLSSFKSPEEVESLDKAEDLKCKVQVKSTKQTQISDFMKVRKRKASQQTTTAGEKKAAL